MIVIYDKGNSLRQICHFCVVGFFLRKTLLHANARPLRWITMFYAFCAHGPYIGKFSLATGMWLLIDHNDYNAFEELNDQSEFIHKSLR